MSARFTAWFSDQEREAISQRAAELNSSENYVVRMAVRAYLASQLSRLSQVTEDTNDSRSLSRSR